MLRNSTVISNGNGHSVQLKQPNHEAVMANTNIRQSQQISDLQNSNG